MYKDGWLKLNYKVNHRDGWWSFTTEDQAADRYLKSFTIMTSGVVNKPHQLSSACQEAALFWLETTLKIYCLDKRPSKAEVNDQWNLFDFLRCQRNKKLHHDVIQKARKRSVDPRLKAHKVNKVINEINFGSTHMTHVRWTCESENSLPNGSQFNFNFDRAKIFVSATFGRGV